MNYFFHKIMATTFGEKLVEVNYFNQVSGSEILKNMIDFCDDATEIIS